MAEAAEKGGPEILSPERPTPLEEDVGAEVGDFILLIGGRLDGTVAKFYGISEDRITIQPKGTTNTVLHIPLVDGDPDPEYGLQEMQILKKAIRPGFITMVDMHAGQEAETFKDNGEPTGIYRIVSVDEGNDSAVFKDETGAETTIKFDFQGIPRELPFQVIRTREAPAPLPEENTGEAATEAAPVGEVKEEDLAAGEGVGEKGMDEPSDFAVMEEIELPEIEEVRELTSSERIYPDVLQRSEMFSQLIRLLPEAQQKNPIKLQEIRRLVEVFMIMRNKVVDYGTTGEPRGVLKTSYTHLAELINHPELYLSRKVVDMNKNLYLPNQVDEHSGTPIPDDDPPRGQYYNEEGEKTGLFVNFQKDILIQAADLDAAAEMESGERAIGQIPPFLTYLERYRQAIHTPHETLHGTKIFERDEEVLRKEIPDVDTPSLTVLAKHKKRDEFPPFRVTTTLRPFASVRLLKPRKGRFLSGERERIVEGGDTYAFDNILLFPRSTQRDLGPIRSGYMVQDVALGMTKPQLLEDILEELNIEEFPTADSILNLGVKGNLLGNVELKDWLTQQDMRLSGLSDVYRLLQGYGVQNIEWSTEQVAVFVEKIEQHIASLRIHLAKQREENATSLANLRFAPNSLLQPESATALFSTLQGEPILQKVLEEIKEYMGDLAEVDTNWFTYVFLKYPDLTLAVLGKQPELVARERLRNVREQFLQALGNGYRAKMRVKHAGNPPLTNKCKHVEDLSTVRKAAQTKVDEPRDVTKMRLLIKFLGKYRSKTEDNWIWCNLCNQHLLCAHEHLQIQEFIRPKEKEILHKELLLKFSGGVFGGKFICRVCGQAIQDLDFDTNLEFDDEGRPMMGRSVMVDQDQIEVEEVEGLLAGPAEKKEEIDFGTEHLNEMYRTLKTIVGLVGVLPEDEDFRKMVGQLSTYISSLPSREVYARQSVGKKVPDYDIFYSVRYISAAGAIVLINIQSHIPDYIVYYTNTECRNGLFGFPLEGPENTTGIQCLTSVLAGINENTFPWNRTGLQKSSNFIQRTASLLPFIQKAVELFAQNPITQLQLKKKREYQQKTVGYVGTTKQEIISSQFRPIPYILSAEEAAAEAIVPAAASEEKKATAWIQTAHRLARKGSALNPESPFTETTCCLHRITNPTEYWATTAVSELPTLEKKAVGQPPFRSGTVTNTFYTEPVEEIVGKTNPNEYYKLFTRVCYKGERKGLPHELGLGSKPTCMNCGINFLQNPALTLVPELSGPSEKPVDGKQREREQGELLERYETELKAHIEGQGIEITEESFTDLLHITQKNGRATADSYPEEPKKENTFRKIASLQNEPFPGWVDRLQEIHVNLRDIGDTPSTVQIATASEKLVEVIAQKEEDIRRRIGPAAFKVLESITRKGPRECGEALTSYFLIPFQRCLTKRGPKSFSILKSYGLSPETRDDILTRGLGNHLELLQGGVDLTGILRSKVRLFVDQLSECTRTIFPFLRQALIPGGNVMIVYIQRALIMGYIQMYLNPNFVPEKKEDEKEEREEGAVNVKFLAGALTQALTKYARGSSVPSDEEIRTTLARRTEMENQKFLKRLDKMTSERRKVEVELKKKGMGEWAVGGTKAIRQYDADRYEAERIERAQAGLVDYDIVEGDGERPYDMFGYVGQEGNIDDAAGDYGLPHEGEDD